MTATRPFIRRACDPSQRRQHSLRGRLHFAERGARVDLAAQRGA